MEDANEQTRRAWETNAAFWDGSMGEGNHFVDILLWPPTERLLAPRAGQRILDVACGNGLYSRKLAALGVQVTAIDFSQALINLASAKPACPDGSIDYRCVDATDADALLALGEGHFDSVLCAMGLFDMADIAPLARTLPRLLRPSGAFVFSVLHPCFNNSGMAHVAETFEDEQGFTTRYAVKVWEYMTAGSTAGVAMDGQPVPHLYFHRPLELLLGTFLRVGLVLDGIEESSFPPDHGIGTDKVHWNGHFSEIPPVLVARMRPNHPGEE